MENLFYTILISVDFAQYEILRAKVCKFGKGIDIACVQV